MMITIKQGIITLLVSFTVFFFMPFVSFASSSYPTLDDFDLSNFQVDIDNLSNLRGPDIYDMRSNTQYGNQSYLSNKQVFGRATSSRVTDYRDVRYAYFVDGNFFDLYYQSGNYYNLESTYKYYYYFSDGVDNTDITLAMQISTSSSFGNVSSGLKYTNIPMFTDRNKMITYLTTGNFDPSDIKNSDYLESPPSKGSPSSLGYIKNVNYSHNNNTSSQGMYEVVSWGSTSTTGIDLSEKINGYDRYRVEFALRDQSTIAKNSFYNGFQSNQDILDEWERTKPDPVLPFDINSIVSRLAGGLAGGLAEHVYPYGGTNRAIKQGLITTAPSFNKMISMGDTPASNRRYAFNALHEYTSSSNFAADAPEIHSSLTGVYNTNLPNFLKGGWFESIVSNSNYYNIADYHLSYNIYARIVDTKDKVNGNWLLIDKHGNPIGAEDDRMNGGYTSRPIKLPDFDPGTDWTDAPDDVDVPDGEIEDNDSVKDEPLGTGYDDGSDNSGSGTTNIYNNYTYNYDNRSWIENHYDNETVQDANEGIDWLKLFSGFFSIFLILFGPFLPEWAVVLVTVATPIILGLAIFKVIKGIIPFV